jgi:hypothetical protein
MTSILVFILYSHSRKGISVHCNAVENLSLNNTSVKIKFWRKRYRPSSSPPTLTHTRTHAHTHTEYRHISLLCWNCFTMERDFVLIFLFVLDKNPHIKQKRAPPTLTCVGFISCLQMLSPILHVTLPLASISFQAQLCFRQN